MAGTSRALRLLLPWAQPAAMEALYLGLRVEEPSTAREFYEVANRRRVAFNARGAVTVNVAVMVEPLDPALQPLAGEVLASGTYLDRYVFLGGEIVRLPLSGLLTPQVVADWDYVAELEASAPAPGDEEAVFRLCFGDDEIGDPLILSGGPVQSATIKLPRNQPPWIGPLRAVRTPGRLTLSVDLEARARFIQVALVPLGDGQGRVVVVNGVHRLLALLSAHHDHAYGIARVVSPQELQGSFDQSPALIADPTGRPLPARLDDFLDDGLFDVVRQTQIDGYLRMLVHPDNVFTAAVRPEVVDVEPSMPLAGTIVDTLHPVAEAAPDPGPPLIP